VPNWLKVCGLYRFRRDEEKKEENREEILNSLLITFRALMSDLDLDTWMGWCEVKI
jgi:hypothetical protein